MYNVINYDKENYRQNALFKTGSDVFSELLKNIILKIFVKNKNDINILGISYYHDASAAHLSNGEIISAFQEERFTRIKFDPNFPINSINLVWIS